MGQRSSFGQLPSVLKARHSSGSAYCWIEICLPKQADRSLFSLGSESAIEDRSPELHAHTVLISAHFHTVPDRVCNNLKTTDRVTTAIFGTLKDQQLLHLE